MMSPLFSIVIANYNYGRFLEDAIRSVVTQSFQDFELIICDAASTDNSIDVIRKYAAGLQPNTQLPTDFQTRTSKISWWCSEKDAGQSAAFNKGFSHARGRFLTWLNADDILMPGALEAVAREIKKYPKCEWFVGSMFRFDADLKIISCFSSHRFSWLRAHFGSLTGCGPSTFFTKRLLNAVGGVDEDLHFVMDTDLWYRFALNQGASYRRTVHPVWGLREHSDSKTSGFWFDETNAKLMETRKRFVEERSRALNKYFPFTPMVRKLILCLSVNPFDHIRAYLWNKRYVGQTIKIGGAL